LSSPGPLDRPHSGRRNVPNASNLTSLDVARSDMFAFKKHLVGSETAGVLEGVRQANTLWIVKWSSNGVASGASDLWLAPSDLVYGNDGSNHSSIVLENALTGYQILLSCNSASFAYGNLSATEIAAPFVGGSVTTNPLGGKEFTANSGSPATGTNMQLFSDLVPGNLNYTHFVCSDSGAWYFMVSRPSAGVQTFICFLKTNDNAASDTRNWFLFAQSLVGQRGCPSYSVLVQNLSFGARCPNGQLQNQGGLSAGLVFGGTVYPANTIAIRDAITAQLSSGELRWASLSPQFAHRGVIPNLIAAGAEVIGGSYPSVAAQTHVLVGDFFVPFPGAGMIV
jgi:hypothetical protein